MLLYRTRQNKQEFFGSRKVEDKFKTLYEGDASWKQVFNEDQSDINGTTDLYLNIDRRNAYRTVQGNQRPQLLPFSLHLMSFEDKSKYLIELTLLNYKVIQNISSMGWQPFPSF